MWGVNHRVCLIHVCCILKSTFMHGYTLVRFHKDTVQNSSLQHEAIVSVWSKHEPLRLSVCPFQTWLQLTGGPRLQREVSTSLLKGPIKPTARAKERDNGSIQRLWQAPSTQSVAPFCLAEGRGVDLWVCLAVFRVLWVLGGERERSLCVCLCFGVFDWQQLWEGSKEPVCVYVCERDAQNTQEHTETHRNTDIKT